MRTTGGTISITPSSTMSTTPPNPRRWHTYHFPEVTLGQSPSPISARTTSMAKHRGKRQRHGTDRGSVSEGSPKRHLCPIKTQRIKSCPRVYRKLESVLTPQTPCYDSRLQSLGETAGQQGFLLPLYRQSSLDGAYFPVTCRMRGDLLRSAS